MKTLISIFTLMAFSHVHAQDVGSTERELMGRRHNLTYDYLRTSATIEDQDSVEWRYNAGYRYNFGRFELGGGGSVIAAEPDSGDRTWTSVVGLTARVNIIDNLPGNDFVPYVQVGIGKLLAQTEVGSDVIEVTGNPTAFAAGLQWYPFKEIFAVDAQIIRESGSAKISYGSDDVSVDYEGTAFKLGFTLSFE